VHFVPIVVSTEKNRRHYFRSGLRSLIINVYCRFS